MKKILTIIILLFALPTYAETYGSITVSKLISVYDGDTFRCNIKEWPPIIGKNISVRILGIDTPEIKCSVKKKGKAECDRLKALARTAKKLTKNQLQRAKIIELRNIQRGKYFRILADVYVDGRNLADILIKNGFAVPYDGGTKPEW